MSAWNEQRGADGSYQAIPARSTSGFIRKMEINPHTGVKSYRRHALPEPTAPVADIPAPTPFFTPLLSFSVGVLVGAASMGLALALGLQHLSALPH